MSIKEGICILSRFGKRSLKIYFHNSNDYISKQIAQQLLSRRRAYFKP